MANLTQLQKDLISTSTYDGIKSDFSANVGQLGTAVIENVVPVSLNTPTINGGTTYLETVGQNSIKQDGDYIKITGNNFTESINVVFGFSRENLTGIPNINITSGYLNSKVLFSNSNTIIASVSSFSTKSATALGYDGGQTQYKIFVFNSDGTYAFKRLPTERIVSNYGYFAGGWSGPSPSGLVVSNLRRLDFSSETTNADNRGNLVNEKSWAASAQNKTYGYVFFGAGQSLAGIGPPTGTIGTYNTVVSRINFSNDSTSQQDYLTLNAGAYGVFGHTTYSSPTAFYFGYGLQSSSAHTPASSNIMKMVYDNSTVSTAAKAHENGISCTGDVSISDYGYSLGGAKSKLQAGFQLPSSPSNVYYYGNSCTSRLNFTNDTNENIIRASSSERTWSSGTVDYNNSRFYFVGGLLYTRRLTTPSSVWTLQKAPTSIVLQYFNDTFYTTTNTTQNIGISLVSNAVDNSYFINSTFTSNSIPYANTLEFLMNASSAITRLQFSNGTLVGVSNTSDASWSSVGLTGYI